MSPLTEPTRLILKKDSVAATDTNIREVSLLLHGNGANGSTTITDSSLTPKTVTAVGNARISTAQSKFNGASIYLDGTGDYATVTSSPAFAFGAGDFTVEAWIRTESTATYQMIFSTRPDGGNYANGLSLYTFSGTSIGLYSNGFLVTGGSLIRNSSFYHIAASRIGSSLRLFVEGVQVGATTANVQNFSQEIATIGANGDGLQAFGGYIDELRITKGVARYTSNFTPPTAPFPDF